MTDGAAASTERSSISLLPYVQAFLLLRFAVDITVNDFKTNKSRQIKIGWQIP